MVASIKPPQSGDANTMTRIFQTATISLLAYLALALAPSASAAWVAPSCPAPSGPNLIKVDRDMTAKVAGLLNHARVDAGMPAFTVDTGLTSFAFYAAGYFAGDPLATSWPALCGSDAIELPAIGSDGFGVTPAKLAHLLINADDKSKRLGVYDPNWKSIGVGIVVGKRDVWNNRRESFWVSVVFSSAPGEGAAPVASESEASASAHPTDTPRAPGAGAATGTGNKVPALLTIRLKSPNGSLSASRPQTSRFVVASKLKSKRATVTLRFKGKLIGRRTVMLRKGVAVIPAPKLLQKRLPNSFATYMVTAKVGTKSVTEQILVRP